MDTEELRRRAKRHASLSDQYRLRIVDELAISDRSPSELAETLGLRSNLLAHHLQVLEDVGLVSRISSHGDRRRRYLRLRRAALGALTKPLALSARRVVFVCTANSARSQLAAGAWNQRHQVPAESAGTHPADSVHPKAVAAAKRVGIDLKDARPRPLAPNDLGASALVVTVCDRAHEDLAKTDGAGFLHWSIPDPAAIGTIKSFDQAATEILDRVDELVPLVSSKLN
ncbi:MAG: helix-turn-helix domain-containing protein [Actinomycetota bacterium]|nr:helix-turn-helix domain-containing protein [Actinomycetota bacterium]